MEFISVFLCLKTDSKFSMYRKAEMHNHVVRDIKGVSAMVIDRDKVRNYSRFAFAKDVKTKNAPTVKSLSSYAHNT